MPASIIVEYKKDTVFRAISFEAETTFFIFSMVFTFSPGTILSGLYPVEKSILKINLDFFSNIGVQISSVTPGYTVDSYITIESFFKTLPIISLDDIKGCKSGVLSSFIGVGTVTIYTLQSLI